jgi:hypothetical protein
MSQALGFLTDKEVVVFPWAKKPDVELVDPSGEYLTFYLDVTLPALHQEAITTREEVFDNARKLKAKSYPHKDLSGRLLTESCCLPFILSSMGGLCSEGHEFLKICKKKNKAATLRMMDVLVTQHSKWTAKRIRRALFGQSFVDFNADPWTTSRDSKDSVKPEANKKKAKKKQSRIEREFSQGEKTTSQATTITDSTPIDEEVSDSPFHDFSPQKAGTATEQQSSPHLSPAHNEEFSRFHVFSSQEAGTATEQQSSPLAQIEDFSQVSSEKRVKAKNNNTEFFELSPR